MKQKPRHDENTRPLPPAEERAVVHPLDFLERMFTENAWEFSRPNADSFSTVTNADWTEYNLVFEWQRESQVLAIACSPALTVPDALRARVARLVESVNLELWFGRFEFLPELLPQSSQVQFRYGVPLYMLEDSPQDLDGVADSEDGSMSNARFCSRIARLLESILGLCERYYPAFRYALAEEEPSRDELRLALSASEGHA